MIIMDPKFGYKFDAISTWKFPQRLRNGKCTSMHPADGTRANKETKLNNSENKT